MANRTTQPTQALRMMPHAKEVEAAVIGALLLESSAYSIVSHRLNEGLFYDVKHQEIYKAIRDIAKRGGAIDLLTVTNELISKGIASPNPQDDALIRPYDIAAMASNVSGAAHIEYHVSILEEKAHRRAGIEKLQKVSDAAFEESGEYATALTDLREFISDKASSSKLIDILKDPTEEEFSSIMKVVPTGIPVNYEFESGDGVKKQLVIPGGALSFICAPTSHGKSTFLRNLALQISLQPEEGRVLYFTFEESTQDLWAQFLNLYIGKDLHRPTKTYNNFKSIKRFFREGTDAMEHWSYDAKRSFYGYLTNFKKNVICMQEADNRGKLKVINKDLDIAELVEGIEFYCRNMAKQGEKIKAVFIDYVQLLTVKGKSRSRKEELVEVCTELMHLSVRMGIPFVMAAQLNRETKSPLMLFSQNISDASDIEKCANLIICLWDSKQEAQDPNYYSIGGKDGKQGKINPDAQKLENRGFFAGGAKKYNDNPTFNATPEADRNTVYAKITKYRGEEVGLDAVLKWHKNTGKIIENITKQDAQTGLPFEPPTTDMVGF